jgi:hypothetical protein
VSKISVRLTAFASGVALIAGSICPATAQTGVPANVLLRTKRIVSGAGSGTAFTIDVDGKQYLITAKHIMAQTPGTKGTVRLCDTEAKCNEVAVSILRCADPVDIAVLVPDHQLTVTFELVPEAKSMIFGQEIFFVGFPYGDTTLNTNTPDGDIGFIRRATLSAQEKKQGWARLYLDGRNNPGFSGSAIVYRDLNVPDVHFKVAGVISGYRPDVTEVMRPVPIEASAITAEDRARSVIIDMADGTHRKLTPTGDYVSGNTGIVIGYSIDTAVDLIRQSELKGPEVAK